MNRDSSEDRQVWPRPPDVARYLYVGELVGEENFRIEKQRTRAKNVFYWLVGLFEDKQQPLTLVRPQSGVVDAAGRIYVTDAGRPGVFVFDEPQGRAVVWELADGQETFLAPLGIALGPNGQVLVADGLLGYVARLNRDGQPVGAIGRGILKRPTGLARDPAKGLIYVADTDAHDIKVFDDDGRLVSILGRRGSGEGEFNFPTHLSFARGELYVSDTMNSRVQVFTSDGETLKQRFGERGLFVGNMVRPKGVAVDDEGNIYVVESYYDHLLVYNSAGQYLLGLGGTGKEASNFYLPSGVWVDGRNRVFVADMFNGRIKVFQFLGGH